MNLTQLHKRFGTQKQCVAYLEKIRWNKKVVCPYCESIKTRKNKSNFRHQCKSCKRTFSVLVKTIFEHTRLPLPLWFQIISLMVNAKRGISARNITRNTGLPYKTTWYICQRVRAGMIDNCDVLQNMVEMDEAFIGGKPRRKYSKDPSSPNYSNIANKRGRGTKQTSIIGVTERNGKVVLNVSAKINGDILLKMLKRYVKTDDAIVITDSNRSYNKFDDVVEHLTINHSKGKFVRGVRHTNTIDGFFGILKNTIKGNYIAISKKYLPFYLVHSAYVYNHRHQQEDLFETFISDAVHSEPVMKYNKPLIEPKKLIEAECETPEPKTKIIFHH